MEEFSSANIRDLNDSSVCDFCELERKITFEFRRRVADLEETLNAKIKKIQKDQPKKKSSRPFSPFLNTFEVVEEGRER